MTTQGGLEMTTFGEVMADIVLTADQSFDEQASIISHALYQAGYVIVPRETLKSAKSEIEWWVNNHRCCEGHEVEALTQIDAALGTSDHQATEE